MIQDLKSSGIMAIVRTASSNEAREIARSLIASKVSVLEFTTTCPNVFDLVEEFSHETSIHIGVGTAMTASDVLNAKRAGAQFVVSPNTDIDVIRVTKSAGLISMPGVATATDVAIAIAAGCDALKLFPASTYGPGHLKALRDPFPNQIWVATGGVNKENVASWFGAGADAFGLGGPLSGGGASEIGRRVELFRAEIANARTNTITL
jgi:2-dehydro-3-deoxyphosphogluconate aldolase/(4S)-4-hydroxy-2-oxoglutarate aldolase